MTSVKRKLETSPTKDAKKTKEEGTEPTIEIPSQVSQAGVVLDRERATKAVEQLLIAAAKLHQEKNSLFEGDTASMWIQLTLTQIPEQVKFAPRSVALPHPFWNDLTEACFIAKVPQRKYKDFLDEAPVPAIKKVVDVQKLIDNYNTPRYKREFCNSFEVFFCDSNLYERMPAACGTFFQRRNKLPVPVRLGSCDSASKLQNRLQKALSATYWKMKKGPTVSVRIGFCSMSAESLVDNLMVVSNQVVKDLERIGHHVSSIGVSSLDLPFLPLWAQTVTKVFKADAEKVELLKKRRQEKLEKRKEQEQEEAVEQSSDDEPENKPIAEPAPVVKVDETARVNEQKKNMVIKRKGKGQRKKALQKLQK